MMHLVDREYRLTPQEAQNAIWNYLKHMDKPVPPDARKLNLSWNGPGEVVVKYCEQIDK